MFPKDHNDLDIVFIDIPGYLIDIGNNILKTGNDIPQQHAFLMRLEMKVYQAFGTIIHNFISVQLIDQGKKFIRFFHQPFDIILPHIGSGNKIVIMTYF